MMMLLSQRFGRRVSLRLAAPALVLGLAACGAPQMPPPPPPEVDVVTILDQPIPNIINLPGRVEAVRTAEVRARINGIVQARMYQEGSNVRAGQPLFRIDRREMQANYASAQATLQRAQASATNARQVVQRYSGLVGEQAISGQEYDSAQANLRAAMADVAQAQAQVRTAQLSLDYASVDAPIAGRVGRALVTEGALVSAGEATLMTTIEQVDRVYVNFSQSNSAVLALRRDMASGTLDIPLPNRVVVKLEFEDGTSYPIEGHLDFLDFSVAESTGTISIRSEFSNPAGALLPGQFVRAKIYAGVRQNGITVPQRAVRNSADGASVLVVGRGNLAIEQKVKLGALEGDRWIITEGLKPGDVVIVNGLQKVMPGKPVRISNKAQNKSATAK